MLVLIH